ncbi:MAG: sugar phosphate isomerase/epimerase family protein [Planctomycetota bacterium]|jgi:sugar phosphate isomerase/epimerase
MITFSAFADEIDSDLTVQMDTCEANGVKCIDVRGIDNINVAEMTLEQVAEYRKRLDGRGFAVPCIGSPIGKIKISDDFEAHLELLRHCCDVARGFRCDRIRMFSFYPTDGMNIVDQRGEAMERMARMVELAEREQVFLYHENESAIYGGSPEGFKDIFATIKSDNLKGIFDPANFITDGFRPFDDCWQAGLAELTDAFHIKDKIASDSACVPAGEGTGQFEEIFTDLAARGFDDTMTLEPHLAAAGQFSGFTGPALFAKAANALKAMCDKCGLRYVTY